MAGPPVPWHEWVVQGTLIDELAVVRGFLRPVMERNRDWSASTQLEVRELLLAMGYEASFASEPAPGGVRAIIMVAPIPVVRIISMSVDMRFVTRLLDPIVREELVRQMKLRPGSTLAIDDKARSEHFAHEAARLEDQLRNQGFYDARVTLSARDTAPYAVALTVDVAPGPAYHVEQVDVVGNTAVPTATIAK